MDARAIKSRAGKGDKDRFIVREGGELVVLEDRELNGSKIETLAGLTNEVTDVEVGF